MSLKFETETLEVAQPVRNAPTVLLTYEQIRNEICPRYFDYIPSLRTVQRWLVASNLRKIRMNASPGSGGGVVYFNRRAVEAWLARRTQG